MPLPLWLQWLYIPQSVQHLLKQLEQVNRDERLHILRDILAGEYTRFTEEYRALNINMRMAFWHRVASK
jgi:anthranilate phosphoribosyltransferase